MRRLVVVVSVLVALVAGIALGGRPELLPGPVRSALVGDSDAQILDQALRMISADFYRQTSRTELVDAALDGMVGSLDDRFSAYLNPRARDASDLTRLQRFEGVGLNVEQIPAGLRVTRVFEGGPAAEAGVRAGDAIVAVDGERLRGQDSEDSVQQIKGRAGTEVALTLRRGDERLERTMRRAAVSIPITDSRLIEQDGDRIGYVRLTQFREGAGDGVNEDVRELLDDGVDGLVLDLRDNGGGLLNEAVTVASVFIEDGPIVSTRGRTRSERTLEAEGPAIPADVPVVVLVNGNSASASEIVAGALQDTDRAEIVGTRTFGKGVFQEIEPLPNGGALDITVGEFFTPSGRNLGPREGKPGGIEPDVRAADDPETEPDEALDRAIGVLADRAG